MRSIFLRIYLGILLAVVVLGAGAYGLYDSWHNKRLQQYLIDNSRGSVQLIAEGLQRHQGERREQWLSLSRRVTGLQIELLPTAQHPSNPGPLQRIENSDWSVFSHYDDQQQLTLYLSNNSAQLYAIPISEPDINEQLMRGTALLILNELGRHGKEQRQQRLARLQVHFHYPLSWLKRAQVTANYLQKRALSRGNSVVDFTTGTDGKQSMRTLAPIGNSGDYLQLGPVGLYQPFPLELIYLSAATLLILLAATCFLLVRPLEKRLGRMAQEVDALQLSGQSSQLTVDGNDALTALAEKINAMSQRILQLLQHQRELNHAVSHELKTPLARLTFRRELALQKLSKLAESGSDTKAVAQHLEGMETSLTELNSLVEEILLYARLESTAPEMNLSRVKVAVLCDELLQPLRSQFSEMEFSHDIPADIALMADQHYLKRALSNLINNAQRFADNQVSIVLEQRPQQLIIHIDDDGQGIPEEHWQSVLQPFSRVESSRNRETGGTGLGLAIVQQIAEWHQGDIRVSRAPLGGARLSLQIPLQLNVVESPAAAVKDTN